MNESEANDIRRELAELRLIVEQLRRGRFEADEYLFGSGNSPTVRLAFALAGQSRWDESSATPDTDAPESWATPTATRIEAGATEGGGLAIYSGGTLAQDVWLGSDDVTIDGSLAGTSFSFLDISGAAIAVEASPLVMVLRGVVLTPGSGALLYTLTADQTGFTTASAPGVGPLKFIFGRKKRATV